MDLIYSLESSNSTALFYFNAIKKIYIRFINLKGGVYERLLDCKI